MKIISGTEEREVQLLTSTKALRVIVYRVPSDASLECMHRALQTIESTIDILDDESMGLVLRDDEKFEVWEET